MPGPASLKQTQHSPQHSRSDSTTGTFTPKFINALSAKNSGSTESARDLAEFSGKRWVWLKDDKLAFVKGWVTEDNGDTLQVRCDNEGIDRTVSSQDVDKVNPPKFNMAEDMADLTYLNEASVIHNLRQRYENDLIYVRSRVIKLIVDLLGSVPGRRQSVQDASHLWLRLHRRLQRKASRRYKTPHLCHLRYRLP
jgi:myosin protein heavy chain